MTSISEQLCLEAHQTLATMPLIISPVSFLSSQVITAVRFFYGQLEVIKKQLYIFRWTTVIFTVLFLSIGFLEWLVSKGVKS